MAFCGSSLLVSVIYELIEMNIGPQFFFGRHFIQLRGLNLPFRVEKFEYFYTQEQRTRTTYSCKINNHVLLLQHILVHFT
jgi:hypothetical protein